MYRLYLFRDSLNNCGFYWNGRNDWNRSCNIGSGCNRSLRRGTFRQHRRSPRGWFLKTCNLRLSCRNDFLVLVGVFQKVGNVQERVPLETNVDKCRLHTGKDLGDPTFIYVPDDTLGTAALDGELDEFVIFEDCELGLLGSRRNDQFLLHRQSPMAEAARRTGTLRYTSRTDSDHELSWNSCARRSNRGLPQLNSAPQRYGQKYKKCLAIRASQPGKNFDNLRLPWTIAQPQCQFT